MIFFSFLFILVAFSTTTLINLRQSKEVRENAEYLSRSTSVIRLSNRLQRNILYMERGLRGYLLTGEQLFIQSTDSAINDNRAILKELESLVADTSQRRYLDQIALFHQRWIEEYANPLRLAKVMSYRSAKDQKDFNLLYREEQAVREEERINQQLSEAFTQFNNQEYRNRDYRRAVLNVSEQRTKDISFLLTTLSVVVGLLIAVFLAGHISRRIRKMVHLANEIARGNYTVSITDRSNDELSQLSHSLDHMASVLQENISLLKRKNEELDKYAYIASHDLKAPLRGIDNVVSWIEEDHSGELSPKVTEYLGLIKGRIRRAENLIGGILMYSRIGKEQVVKERVDVGELIGEVKESIYVDSSTEIVLPNPLPVLYTEKIPLVQVFSNLLSNAVKYSDKEKGKVTVRCREEEGRYHFTITDNGPGIAKAYHDKIFVIFQTLQERDRFESTGVGLAIVKKILDDRKERITLVSAPGEGASFTFTWSK
ncbi:MAG TPA: ATP-binding protein [Chitinophagaceae bacterium]